MSSSAGATDNDHAVCGRCASPCCHLLGSDDDLRAPMSCSDVERVAAHTGRKPAEIAVLSQGPSPIELANLRHQCPTMAGLFSPENTIYLRTRGGSCVLLDQGGRCSLPWGVRPRYCALYPLWFGLDPIARELIVLVAGTAECQAVKESSSDLDAILRKFGLRWNDVKNLVELTYAEIDRHAEMSSEALVCLVGPA